MKSIVKKLSIALAVPLMMLVVVGFGGVAGAQPANMSAVTNRECMQLSGRNVAACAACTAGDAATFNANEGTCNDEGANVQNNAPELITTIINIMLYIIGILCVIFIIWGGITYTTSRGRDEKVKNAKNTILYATIGLVVALIAWALTNWVFDLLG